MSRQNSELKLKKEISFNVEKGLGKKDMWQSQGGFEDE